MPKKQKGAAKAAQDDGVDIFAQLGWDRLSEPKEEPVEDDARAEEDRVKALEAKLAKLDERVAVSARTNAALLSQSPVVVSGPQKDDEPPKIDTSGLPDPVSDPEGHTAQLTARIAAAVEARAVKRIEAIAAENAARAEQVNRTKQLWDQFEENYPDLADNRDFVEIAAVRVAEKAQARGVDMQKYMTVGAEQFLADVAEETKRRFGKAIEAERDTTDEEEEPTADNSADGNIQMQSVLEKMNGGRTVGIQGGIPTGGGAKGKGKNDEGSDFIADIHQLQRKLGLY
jgi:hypothetical protein